MKTGKSLPYFLSTRETAVEMSLLQQLDAETLIGQLSYKQRAELYNYKYGYVKATKRIQSIRQRKPRPFLIFCKSALPVWKLGLMAFVSVYKETLMTAL